jgi:hypothetical protein
MGIAPWADGLGSFAVSIPNIFIKYRYLPLNYSINRPKKTKKVLNLAINAKFALNIPTCRQNVNNLGNICRQDSDFVREIAK